ncbi:two-component system sporulation sensor kinase B [Psychrobacillus insolitus]|uniref:histidine kinase n=1 Tax=Psychrobacillus insolitus TaxID=1461 RepID=A0A2W7MYS4_9BACI|nr:ATP-binding protein [Psychrobacillus insolitus]PZX02868.1 two-component system sporulation sensor kinase B [Psychrobacillus insolitus]
MNDIPHVLDQVLIVLFPILIYQLFFNESDLKRRKPYSKLSLLLLIMLCLTMSFPIEIEEGYPYDFRFIPIIISFIYVGVIPGLIITTVSFIYRAYLGGDGIDNNFFDFTFLLTLITTLLVLLMQWYRLFTLRNKAFVVSFLFLITVIHIMLYLYKSHRTEQLTFMIIFFIGAWISLLMVVFIIDYVDKHQQIQQELQRADKLNVISQLAASVAHEIRNPLTTVQGFLQLMSIEPQVHSNHKKYIDISLKELNDAQSIINDYLSLAKPQTEELSSINLSAEVKNAVSLINSYSNIKGIRIESSIQELLHMNGNRAELKQILVNIMKNGIEAMKENGLLTVRLYSNLGEIFIEIIDTGMGMTKEQIHKVGTPFYSTKDKGTGVGLTISYQLVQSMKGKLEIESERGKGTKFTIRFPCYS